MVKHSSLNVITDNNNKMAPISYEAATGGNKANPEGVVKGLIVPKVLNVSGSTAGANSGEFHLYRKLRRFEADRVEMMEADEKRQREEEEFREILQRNQLESDLRTSKRAEKRKKAKERMKNKRSRKHITQTSVEFSEEDDESEEDSTEEKSSDLKNELEKKDNGDNSEAEVEQKANSEKTPVLKDEDIFANDGSLLAKFLASREVAK